MKKVIINADDFGHSEDINKAILYAYNAKTITSASLMTNMDGFENAISEILPQIPKLDIGFHFNLTEGKSLSKSDLLCDKKGFFNNGFISILAKSINRNFLNAIEVEFRTQIEKIPKDINISHIDSHRHIHAIPSVFKLISKLAKEYNIKYIRTQREKKYFLPSKMINLKFPSNVLKNILLNTLTTLNDYPYTNNYFIGILYTGYMDKESIIKGLKSIKEDSIIEVILHPTINKKFKNNYIEFLTLQNPTLREEIQDSGFELTQFSKLF